MEHAYLKQYHDPSDEPVSSPLDIDSDGLFFFFQIKVVFFFFRFFCLVFHK